MSSFSRENSPEAAVETTLNFHKLRTNPPESVRFAYPGRETKALTRQSPAALRPFLKTDQGPGGNFLPVRFKDKENYLTVPDSTITQQTGLALPEPRLMQAISDKPDLLKQVTVIQDFFAQGEEVEFRRALGEFQEELQAQSILQDRVVEKGRAPFFLIRPVGVETGAVELTPEIIHYIDLSVHSVIALLEAKAHMAATLVSRGVSSNEAVERVTEMNKTMNVVDKVKRDLYPLYAPKLLYFQADVILNHTVRRRQLVDRINIPDVGFFLTQLNHQGNPIVSEVQNIVRELEEPVIERLITAMVEADKTSISLVTRDEVLHNQEDMLEQMEISALTQSLEKKGVATSALPLSDLPKVDSNSLTLLLNISPKDPEFEDLLIKYAKGEIACYPDPFLLLFKEDAHNYPTARLNKQAIANLYAVANNIDLTKQEMVYRQMGALQHFLHRCGFDKEDIFYFTDGSGKLAPAFRYDLRSMVLALNEFPEADSLDLRGLTFGPESAIIHGADGPRLAAFRFMYTRKTQGQFQAEMQEKESRRRQGYDSGKYGL